MKGTWSEMGSRSKLPRDTPKRGKGVYSMCARITILYVGCIVWIAERSVRVISKPQLEMGELKYLATFNKRNSKKQIFSICKRFLVKLNLRLSFV